MAEAAATVRTVAGTVDGKNNGAKILSGAGFYVQRTDRGKYYISFDPVFNNLYGASATVVRSKGVTSTLDGCQLMDIANNALYVTTGNADGDFNDQVFSFIVVGV